MEHLFLIMLTVGIAAVLGALFFRYVKLEGKASISGFLKYIGKIIRERI